MTHIQVPMPQLAPIPAMTPPATARTVAEAASSATAAIIAQGLTYEQLAEALSQAHTQLAQQEADRVPVATTSTQHPRDRHQARKLSRENKKLAESVARLTAELATRKSAFDKLKASSNETIQARNKQIDGLSAAHRDLMQKTSGPLFSARYRTVKAQGKTIKELEDKVNRQTVELAVAESFLKDANARADRAENELTLLKENIVLLQETETKHLADIERLENANTDLKTSAELDAEQASTTEKSLKYTIAQFKTTTSVLEEDNENLEAELAHRADQLQDIQSKYNRLETHNSKLTQECYILTSKLAAPRCECAAEVKAMKSEYLQHVRYIEQKATGIIQNLNEDVGGLKQQLDAKNQKLDGQHRQLEAQHQQLETQRQQLEVQHRQLDTKKNMVDHATANTMYQQICRLKHQLDAKDSQLASQNAMLQRAATAKHQPTAQNAMLQLAAAANHNPTAHNAMLGRAAAANHQQDAQDRSDGMDLSDDMHARTISELLRSKIINQRRNTLHMSRSQGVRK